MATINRECPSCGERIPLFAKACPHCGAASQMRLAGLLITGALAVLCLAVVVAAVVVFGGHRLAVTVKMPDREHRIDGPTDDLGWLHTAMTTCESDAEADTGTLRFLVIPLVAAAQDAEEWRAKSLSDVGNALLVGSDDALDGLKAGKLNFYRSGYDFRILDHATNKLYRWGPAGGVADFSTADAGAIAMFNVQILTPSKSDESDWGMAFSRESGTCYWVSAIIGG